MTALFYLASGIAITIYGLIILISGEFDYFGVHFRGRISGLVTVIIGILFFALFRRELDKVK
jgi:hypothetical protein